MIFLFFVEKACCIFYRGEDTIILTYCQFISMERDTWYFYGTGRLDYGVTDKTIYQIVYRISDEVQKYGK